MLKLEAAAVGVGLLGLAYLVYRIQAGAKENVAAAAGALSDFAGYVKDGVYRGAATVSDAVSPVNVVGSIGAAVGLDRPGTLNTDPAKAGRWGTQDTAGAWVQSPNNVIYETVSAPFGGSLGSWLRETQERLTGTGAYSLKNY